MSDDTTVPPEELNKRRRVMQILERFEHATRDVAQCLTEFAEVDPGYAITMRDTFVERLDRFEADEDGVSVRDAEPSMSRSAMFAVIDRLFAEAPKLTGPDGRPDPTQRPALQCHVLLASQMQPLSGALSLTAEGACRMLTPATIDGKRVLAESFFAIEDVVSVMVEREITGTKSSIVGLT